MSSSRMEAFSDGVLAIVITIMVLKLNPPADTTWDGLVEVAPTFLAYVLSYIYVGIYWANHHHLINISSSISGTTLWKNLHWLFWMSLVPLATEWSGTNPLTAAPTMLYGAVLFMCSITYHTLQYNIVRLEGNNSTLSNQIGKDYKGKISLLAYFFAIPMGYFLPIGSYIIYIVIAIIWFVPDKRIELLFGA
ncbi:TMEM175 family protein [Arcanobacterium pinnipediorum]|uniref:TMEM175 family protein n=1 Tax=Arcanobacterium pinnipediorum TaxID=1503041 RepID=A0ABY5AHM9_9ACTO|nr:TMEM175 family protein [Arcanobacterium pinnipediorum]USR78713.1 TMEM175 family protein [Arcanobacterium pinnipediorum]